MNHMVGDAVHVAGFGKGTIREVLNRGRFRVEVKGRLLIATGAQLTRVTPAQSARPASTPAAPLAPESAEPRAARSLDLHGRTVLEAIQDLQAFLNAALLDGDATVRIIHGRSGGRIKAAVHAQLAEMPVRGFALDPRNPGVTVVTL
jgi:dsDNA-specific endonuclease/ATPase MutS2